MTAIVRFVVVLLTLLLTLSSVAQTKPSAREVAAYKGLHLAAHTGDLVRAKQLLGNNVDLEETDPSGRTALHIAAFASNIEIIELLAGSGANMNALENDAYDIVTIAAVANDLPTLSIALQLGTSPGNVTSRYEGTALIAASHLGHHRVVKTLIDAGAPLDHINNLGWTALIEAVILGNGGPDHVLTVKHLVDAGADKTIADRDGQTPLALARALDYTDIIRVLEQD